MPVTKSVVLEEMLSRPAQTTVSETVTTSSSQMVQASRPRATLSSLRPQAGSESLPSSLTGHQTQMLLGTMLGDAHMSVRNKNPSYTSKHGFKQHEYNLAKYRVLSEFVRTPPKKAKNGGYGEWSSVWQTLTAPALWPIAFLCLHDGKKLVTQEWLDQLTWEGVAWWYQDDGSLSKNRSMSFHTQGFSKEEVELLASWLTQNGIPAQPASKKSRHNTEHLYWVIDLGVDAAYMLAEKIRPFIVPTMQYKIALPERNTMIVCTVCGEEFTAPPNHHAKYDPTANAICDSKTCKLQRHREVCEKSLTPERKLVRNQHNREWYKAGGAERRAKGVENAKRYRLKHPDAVTASKKKVRDKQRAAKQQSLWTCQRCQLQEPRGTRDGKVKYCTECREIVTREIKHRSRYPSGHPKLLQSLGQVSTESSISPQSGTGPSSPAV